MAGIQTQNTLELSYPRVALPKLGLFWCASVGLLSWPGRMFRWARIILFLPLRMV